MDGLQVLKQLRQLHSPEQLPVIMVTAKDDNKDISEALRAGANDYVTKPVNLAVLRAKLGRHLGLKRSVDTLQIRRQQLEGEVKVQAAQLDHASEARRRAEMELVRAKHCLDHASDAMFGIAADGTVWYFNRAAVLLTGFEPDEIATMTFCDFNQDLSEDEWAELWRETSKNGAANRRLRLRAKNGVTKVVDTTMDHILFDGTEQMFVYVRDVTERMQAEMQLQQARKLAAVGQLAAGIAHEINTPLQFVGDNTAFLQSAFDDIIGLHRQYQSLLKSAQGGSIDPVLLAKVALSDKDADIDYLRNEIPRAISQSLDGISRASAIVKALKAISRPGSDDKVVADINQIVRDTVTATANEWKYVADLTLHLEKDLPMVPCYAQELGQVFLNLLINATHAIGSVATANENETHKGTIVVTTRKSGHNVEISVVDTGGGIPEAIQDRIFEPFFTTKEVGKGTGQSLAIAYSTVIDKHDGELSFSSIPGKGTTFVVRLPVTGCEAEDSRVVA
jgi:PAS domain S-box-containing protein